MLKLSITTILLVFTALTTVAASGPSVGLILSPGAASRLVPVEPEPEQTAPTVRFSAAWREVEGEQGVYDWTRIGPAVRHAAGAGYKVILAVGDKDPLPVPGTDLDAWLGFVRSAVRNFGDVVDVFEIWPSGGHVGSAFDLTVYGFMIKQSALAIRAEAAANDYSVQIAQGAIGAGQLERQRALWSADIAAYVDLLPVVVDRRDAGRVAELLRPVVVESLQHPPAPELWVYVRPSGVGWDGTSTAVTALAAGAAGALIETSAEATEVFGWVTGLQSILGRDYQPAPFGALELSYGDGSQRDGAAVLGRFFRATDFTTLVIFRAPGLAGEDSPRLVIDAPVVRNVRVIDPISGDVRRTSASARPGGLSGRTVGLSAAAAPGAVLFQKQVATPGFELPTEAVDVASSRGLTAEEIIARYQEIQRRQDDRLERFTARGRVDFHFKLGQGGGSVDFSIDSNYFWERGGQLEWEQTDYYFNGNRVKWKNIPELPLIQPEKVITLPLDLTLDRTYRYRLTGEDRVSGREAYVLEFQPAESDSALSLYRGRVWIDKSSFVRLKASVVQTQTAPPVLSNEETDRFAPQIGEDGETYWVFSNIDGQQIWNAAGRSFVVRRELTFSEFEINGPKSDFEARRSEAYASNNQMLRDTERGFRYLERTEEGSRVVKETEDTSQLFAAVGAFKDGSQDNVLPLAGVNYFNYDWKNKNIQVNALFAGVLGFFTASKPDLFGGKIDLTLDAGLVGIKGDDKVFVGDDELEVERIERRTQSVSLRLGVPIGEFVKLNVIGGMRVRDYFESDESDDLLNDFNAANLQQVRFVLPQDHLEWSGSVDVTFNRKGYTLGASGGWFSRSDWEAWGLQDTDLGSFGSFGPGGFELGAAEPVEDAFSRWGVTVFKEWYLPKFQKLRFGADYLNGSNLDRFSRYQFNFFGEDRLNGFSGSGIRFDEGTIARVGYSFNLLEVIRFDLGFDGAQVEEEGSGVGTQSFGGLGFNANFVGPWKTVISAGYGRALTSDIEDLEGEQEFLLFIFKLF